MMELKLTHASKSFSGCSERLRLYMSKSGTLSNVSPIFITLLLWFDIYKLQSQLASCVWTKIYATHKK